MNVIVKKKKTNEKKQLPVLITSKEHSECHTNTDMRKKPYYQIFHLLNRLRQIQQREMIKHRH